MTETPETTPELIKELRANAAAVGFNFQYNLTNYPLDQHTEAATATIERLKRRYGRENVWVTEAAFNQAGDFVPNSVAVYLRKGVQPRSRWQHLINPTGRLRRP